MKPAQFSYHRAGDVAEALTLLERYDGEAKLLAGGQSLVAMMNFRLARPAALIDVTRIGGLNYLRAGPDGLRIGALDRPLPDPGPGHLRRQHRARRRGLRMVLARRAARRADPAARPRR